MEQKPKWLLKSLTIWGALMGILPQIFALFGADPPLDAIARLTELGPEVINGLYYLVATLMVIVGRLRAKAPVTLVRPDKRNPGTPLSAALPVTLVALALSVAVAGCSGLPKPRDAKDALAIAEYTVQGVTDTALAATRAGLIRGAAAREALDKLAALRSGLGVARAAVAAGDPEASLKVQALDGLVLALSAFLEARGVVGPALPPPQARPGPEPSGLVLARPSGLEVSHVR